MTESGPVSNFPVPCGVMENMVGVPLEDPNVISITSRQESQDAMLRSLLPVVCAWRVHTHFSDHHSIWGQSVTLYNVSPGEGP